MAWELEGLVSHLLMLISCAGEQGCALDEILYEIRHASLFSGSRSRNTGEPLSDYAVATVWNWLVSRSDVSVGPNRKFNTLPLLELMTLTGTGSGQSGAANEASDSNSRSKDLKSRLQGQPQIHVSEETMWEAITGHAINHKRVPRSEWLLLLGIASTKSTGILQGDLGRLVDQDKRSVPKRTDALVKKGYIVKRTTLVRGTKTSKLWLKSFALPLPKESDDQAAEREAEMNLSYQNLAANLDPVPWHTRWTGESMDFHALATTIMAVAKEWHVIRLQDLKAKLGVLGMRWQMKIVSKTCRFLNSCGAIQYVAAKLDHKVFKDCIKFNKDLTSKDWSTFLATGKRAGKPLRTALLGLSERTDADGQAATSQINGSRLARTYPWTIDDPLPQKISMAVQSFGTSGLTNPEIYALTLGSSFNRYISSLTTCMATLGVQPSHLQHIQLRSDHIRVGKVASYKYYISQPSAQDYNAVVDTGKEPDTATHYGFSSSFPLPKLSGVSETLSILCGLKRNQKYDSNRPKARGRPKKVRVESDVAIVSHEGQSPVQDSGRVLAVRSTENALPQDLTYIITLRLSSKALATVLGSESSTPSFRSLVSPAPDNRITTGQVESTNKSDQMTSIFSDTVQIRGRGRGRGRIRGRGRGRLSLSTPTFATPGSRPWKCDKCGGSWKNDLGLKYHLEKSQTPCNPEYKPSLLGSGRTDRRLASSIATISEASNNDSDIEPADSPHIRSLQGSENDGFQFGPAAHALTHEEPSFTKSILEPQSVSSSAIVKSWKRPTNSLSHSIRLSVPKTDQGLLSHSATSQPRVVPILQKRGRSAREHSENLTQRDNHEDPNDISASIPSASSHYIPMAENGPTNLQPIKSPIRRQPDHLTNKPRQTSDSESMSHIESNLPRKHVLDEHLNLRCLIEKLLSDQGGALLGGDLILDPVLSTWGALHPGKVAPTKSDCQSVITWLIKNGMIVEHWHAFRDSSASFSKCQLLTLPGIDPFAPQSLELLEEVKRCRKASSIEAAPRSSRGSEGAISGGRGRRPLAKEVAILHAPVYAAQVAAKREQESAIREQSKRQRRSDTQSRTNDTSSILPGTKRKQIRWAADDWQGGIGTRTSYENTLDLSRSGPIAAAQFQESNKFSEDSLPDIDRRRSVRSIRNVERSAQERIGASDPANGDIFKYSTVLAGQNGVWPNLDTHYFDRIGGSFTLEGWMPEHRSFELTSFVQAVKRRHAYLDGKNGLVHGSKIGPDKHFINGLTACFELEMSFKEYFIDGSTMSAGRHSIFLNHFGGPDDWKYCSELGFTWLENGQLTKSSENITSVNIGDESSTSDNEFDSQLPLQVSKLRPHTGWGSSDIPPLKTKRVALVTRALTPLPILAYDLVADDEADPDMYPFSTPHELMAAFVAVRTLMGGADRAIDWGLLLHIFPGTSLVNLRRFWDEAKKQQGSYIINYTRVFQEKLIDALEQNEISMIDFERPKEYDWQTLIRWTTQIHRQDGFQVPPSRVLLHTRFSLEDPKVSLDDWRERFFQVQSSIFARFEAVTSEPGALIVDGDVSAMQKPAELTELDIARSWIKALCSMKDGKYSVEQIRDKFATLDPINPQRTSALFKMAIDQLTTQRIICRSRRPPSGGRPYRLNETYITALSKMAQNSKFDEAAAFKTKMDSSFRRQESMRIPYTLDDGAMMALTNLNAAGRIKLVATNLPNIPFGFEPGNYESRKFPKSYYHFGLEAVPEDSYLYNEQIDLLKVARKQGPPVGGPGRELPQWVDFFQEPNVQLWSEILGAFCFAMATRGSMDINGICNSMHPVLEDFEARLIVTWGQQTGLLTGCYDGLGSSVGEWWWLVVPWLRLSRSLE